MAQVEIRKASERGIGDLDWAYAQHTFSFADYYDPEHTGFSDLIMLNDNRIYAGCGLDMHAHENLEIISYVVKGALEHKDSLGNSTMLYPGDIQVVSAGRGIEHSEKNPLYDRGNHLIQIWVVPEERETEPRYQRMHSNLYEKRGQLCLLAAPDETQDSLAIYQDLYLYAGIFSHDETATLDVQESRYFYIHLIRGTLKVNGTVLRAGDGARIRDAKTLVFSDGNDAEVLVFNMRPESFQDSTTK